jgi:hypothetical protein
MTRRPIMQLQCNARSTHSTRQGSRLRGSGAQSTELSGLLLTSCTDSLIFLSGGHLPSSPEF